MSDEVHVQDISLRPEQAEDYLWLHAELWSEVIATPRRAGLHDDRIQCQPGRHLLGQRFRVSGPDPAGCPEASR